MNTYKELVYMVLDELKGMSDDFSYTEDHIIYLLEKHRAFLLNNDLNMLAKTNRANYLTIDVHMSLERTQDSYDLSIDKLKLFYVSDIVIPYVVLNRKPLVYVENYYDDSIDFTTYERMKYVGYNKFLKRFKYCSISTDNKLHLVFWKNLDYTPKFSVSSLMARLFSTNLKDLRIANEELSKMNVSKDVTLKFNAVFLSPKQVIKLIDPQADIMEAEFPLDSALVPLLVLQVLKELLGASYRPEDKSNDAKDDLADLENFIRNNVKSALRKLIEEDE